MNRLAFSGVFLLLFAFAYVPQAAAESVSLDGVVAPAMDVTLASRAEGDIVEIAVTEGDEVARGDLLIKLDSLTARLILRKRAASLEACKADLRIAELNLKMAEREERLAKGRLEGLEQRFGGEQEPADGLDMRSRQMLDRAKAEINVAELRTEVAESEMTRQEAQVNAADADVALAEIALAQTSITAPFDGVVAKLHVRPGSVLAERGVPLLRIMAPSSVILVNIPCAQTQQLVGKAVTVVTTDGRECAGEVNSMAPMIDNQSQTIRATIGFEPPEDLKETFLPGLMVHVRLELD